MLSKSFRKGRGVVALLLLLSVFVAAPILWAQTAGTGALTGTITDPSGAVVPNALVTATSVPAR